MSKYHCLLEPEKVYHVYTRAVGREKLFVIEDNYQFFLSRFQAHILPIADVLAWCLLPNHFHVLIQVKTEIDIEKHFLVTKRNQFHAELIPDFLMERFSNLLNSYTKAFNKLYQRQGSLFIDFMRRVEVKQDEQFGATIFYIHKNPVHHGYCKQIEDWHWSSYKTILSSAGTAIKRQMVLEWFQGRDNFISYHEQPIYLKSYLPIED